MTGHFFKRHLSNRTCFYTLTSERPPCNLHRTVAKKDTNDDRTGWKDVAAVFALRTADSGLLPWVLVAAFLLGLIYVATRNLDSKDTYALIAGIGTVHGLSWLGWMIAFVEIPIARWAINKARASNLSELKKLQNENDKARSLLKKYKQSELELES